MSEYHQFKLTLPPATESSTFLFHDVPGDGNCFFHTLCHSQTFSTFNHLSLRNKFIKDLEAVYNANDDTSHIVVHLIHELKYENFPEYTSRMSRRGEWASDLEACLIMIVYNVHIFIYQVSNESQELTLCTSRSNLQSLIPSQLHSTFPTLLDCTYTSGESIVMLCHQYKKPGVQSTNNNHFGALKYISSNQNDCTNPSPNTCESKPLVIQNCIHKLKARLVKFDMLADATLHKPWVGCISMPMDRGGTGNLKTYDLCTVLHTQPACLAKHVDYKKLYFDIRQYVCSTNNMTDVQNIFKTKLLPEIERAAFDCGSPIRHHQTRTFKYSPNFQLVCAICYHTYRTKQKSTEGPYRTDSFINSQKKGIREAGKTKSRRTSTSKAMSIDNTCKFKLCIKYDRTGFYIDEGSGHAFHQHHPKLDMTRVPYPSKLLPEVEKETLVSMTECAIGSSVGKTFIHSRLGRHISRQKVAYIGSKSLAGIDALHSSYSNVDQLLKYFEESKDISYNVLWDVPYFHDDIDNTHKQDHVNDNYITSNQPTSQLCSTFINRLNPRDITEDTVDHSSDEAFNEIRSLSIHQRVHANINPNNKIFICVAWSNVHEITLFKRFCEVVYCDVVNDTNNTKNHLLTFSGRTSDGKQFIFLRMYLHNQKLSTFNWAFAIGFKPIIPPTILNKIQLFLVDGDPQQYSQLLKVVKLYCGQAKVHTCAFHLISQNWKKNGIAASAIYDARMESKFIMLKEDIHDWLYSFTKPDGCESQDEYDVSVILLYHFLNSSYVHEILGLEHLVHRLCHWVRNNVLTVMEKMAFYINKHCCRSFYQSTTSPHEGTNFGMKEHGIAVQPCNTLLVSGRKLTLQGMLKVKDFECLNTKRLIGTPLWSDTVTSKFVVTKCESILSQELQQRNNYCSRWLSNDTIEVVHHSFVGMIEELRPDVVWEYSSSDERTDTTTVYDSSSNSTHHKPLFWRVRTVTITDNKCLVCSCCQFQCTGIPCRHIAHVCSVLDDKWEGFCHHDVSVIWWNLYHTYAYDDSCPELSNFLISLRDSELEGPLLPTNANLPENIVTTSKPLRIPAYLRIHNYNSDTVRNILSRTVSSGIVANTVTIQDYYGLSQQSYVASLNEGSEFPLYFGIDEHIDKQYDGNDNSCNNDDTIIFTPFADNILQNTTAKQSRTLLSGEITELCSCLDSLDESSKQQYIEQVRTTLDNITASVRNKLSYKHKNVSESGSVYIMTETTKNGVKRKFNSKNC